MQQRADRAGCVDSSPLSLVFHDIGWNRFLMVTIERLQCAWDVGFGGTRGWRTRLFKVYRVYYEGLTYRK